MSANLDELFNKKQKGQVDPMMTPTEQDLKGKRLSRLPLFIFIFFLILAVGLIAYVMYDRFQNTGTRHRQTHFSRRETAKPLSQYPMEAFVPIPEPPRSEPIQDSPMPLASKIVTEDDSKKKDITINLENYTITITRRD